MRDEPNLTPTEVELEEALRCLTPATPDIDLASAAYEAGRRDGRKSLVAWRAAAALLAVTAGVAALAPRSESEKPLSVARASIENSEAPNGMAVARAEYLLLAQRVIEQGPGVLDVAWQDDPRTIPTVR